MFCIYERSKGKTDTMVDESIKLKSAFRGLGDEDEEGEPKELPLDEELDGTDNSESDLDDEEEEEF